MSGRFPWPAWLGRRRRLLAIVGVVLVARAVLPVVVRRVLATRVSQALGARVTIGEVDLALWRGGIAFGDVAVRPAAAGGDDPPLVAWKRLALAVHWLPLFHRTVRLRTVDLDRPSVALERLANGTLNLLALVPAGAPKAAGAPPSAAGPGWAVGVDRLVLRDGRVRFRDLATAGSEPVEVGLPSIEIRDVALGPGLYGEPAHARLTATVDRGTLRVDARLTLAADGGLVLATDLAAKRLPLRRTRVYLPHVGWRNLRGELAAAVRQRFETGKRNALRGTVWLTGVTVEVPGLDEPALAWQRLTIHVDPLDLLARRVVVRQVDLRGASVAVRPRGGDTLPLLAAVDAGPPPAAAEPPAPAAPWRWSVAALALADSRLHVLGAPPLDVGVGLEAQGLAGDEGAAPAHVKLDLASGEGSLAVDGALRVAPAGFEGSVALDRLDLPPVVAAVGALVPGLLQKGRLAAALRVAAGAAAPPPGAVRVQGSASLSEPWLAGPDPGEFALGAQSLEVGIDAIDVPGGLPARGGPIRVRLGTVRLAAPFLQLTRAGEGLVLPPFTAAAPPGAAPPAAATPPGVEVAIAALRVTDGRIAVTDRTVKPFYEGGLAPLALEVDHLRWPALVLQRLHLEATSAEKGRIAVSGSLAPGGGRIEVSGHQIALRPFNPYATAFSPYSIGTGRLSLSAKASFGAGRYDADTTLTLHGFDLASRAGDSLFQQEFGIPLSMALALLRDVHGDIALDVPVEADASGAKVDVLAVMGSALRRALVNTLASPLKLVGAVLGGGEGSAAAPAPIPFRPGRDQLAPEGDAQVSQLAALLASRPGIGVTLTAAPGAEDARWLGEQALRAELAAPQGVLGTLRTIGERGARQRVAAALDARARDQQGKLDPDDAAALERWLAERPPPAPERLRALAAARLDRVEVLLRDRHGVEPARIARAEPPAAPAEDPPAVRVTLGAVRGSS